jgi:hypothetical protein
VIPRANSYDRLQAILACAPVSYVAWTNAVGETGVRVDVPGGGLVVVAPLPDEITLDGGREMWTEKRWRDFVPRLEKWMSFWEETGRRPIA